MNVSHLTEFLRSLEAPLASAGGSKVSQELALACQLLLEFGEMPLKDFAEFLRRSKEYERTGLLPTGPVKKPRANAKEKVELNPVELAGKIGAITEGALDERVGYEQIERDIKGLLARPSKEVVLQVAKELHLPASYRTKNDAIKAIVSLVTERKFSFDRTRF